MPAHRWTLRTVALGVAVALAGPAAAQFEDPDWPCIQRKVPELWVGQMWPGPMPEEGWRPDEEVSALARRLTPRRVGIEEVRTQAAAFVADLSGEARARRLAELFAAVLDGINRERGQIIAGIARYAHRQADLSAEVEEMQLELASLREAPDEERDQARIAEIEEALAWETRIYNERAQSLSYVCETPVLLERRAFEIARALAELK